MTYVLYVIFEALFKSEIFSQHFHFLTPLGPKNSQNTQFLPKILTFFVGPLRAHPKNAQC